MARIYSKQGRELSTIALIGHSNGFSEGLSKYLQESKLKESIEFGPILSMDDAYFLRGQIYTPHVCSLIGGYDPRVWGANTMVNCFGTSYTHVFNFVADFVKNFKIETLEPTPEFIMGANLCHEATEAFWNTLGEFKIEEKKTILAKLLHAGTYMDFQQKAMLN